jgi:hypothetical protein
LTHASRTGIGGFLGKFSLVDVTVGSLLNPSGVWASNTQIILSTSLLR